MSNLDTANLWLPDAQNTESCGSSLADTLYRLPLSIGMEGELGAGKTTFLRGFARNWGIAEPIVSPTFALEQRYVTERGELIHVDLYRLNAAQAEALLMQSEESPGIRFIEWANRIVNHPVGITLIFEDHANGGRHLKATYQDLPLPSESLVDQWREEVELPEGVILHCEGVAAFADRIAAEMLKRGILVRPLMLHRAAQLHDLLRFVDFRGLAHEAVPATRRQTERWEVLRARYASMRHEAACAAFVSERGYPELSSVILTHGLMMPSNKRTTTEQTLLFYADKRVKADTVVSLEERLEDFRMRYSGTTEPDLWFQEAKRIEQELFGGPPPF